jgi:quercetin dioxygenase-like cupin family protein
MSDHTVRILPLRDDGHAARGLFMRLALAVAPCPPDRACGERLRARVRRSAATVPAPTGTHTVRGADHSWRPVASGVDIKLLHAARGRMTAFIRMSAGASFEAHAHPLPEECLVIEGEIHIGSHRLGAGDLHFAAAGTRHASTYSAGGALLLVHAALPPAPCHA